MSAPPLRSLEEFLKRKRSMPSFYFRCAQVEISSKGREVAVLT